MYNKLIYFGERIINLGHKLDSGNIFKAESIPQLALTLKVVFASTGTTNSTSTEHSNVLISTSINYTSIQTKATTQLAKLLLRAIGYATQMTILVPKLITRSSCSSFTMNIKNQTTFITVY